MAIPKDPFMLLSYVNTQLRDSYASLEELCQALGLDQAELAGRLEAVDYRYDQDQNQFV